MKNDLEYYMALPYSLRLTPDADGTWFVDVAELPGCMSVGDSPQDAVDMIRDAMRAWLEVALEDGIPVPEPRPIEAHSGRFVTRVPRSLHRDLVDAAERDGVSLNQFVSAALARAVGERGTSSAAEPVRKARVRAAAVPAPPAPVYLPVEPHAVAARAAEPGPAFGGGETQKSGPQARPGPAPAAASSGGSSCPN